MDGDKIMKKTLVVLAAGIGSRFDGGIKQLEPIDANGHIIIDYSIHDAIVAGFNKIVFIIRHDIEDDFRNVIGDRIEQVCASHGVEVKYAFQEMSDIPGAVPKGRVKPWGTGHAVLACDGILNGPFAVINSDDYYGRKSFRLASDHLGNGYALIGYQLKNTLSDNGGVTRGICSVQNGKLVGIDETRGIVKTASGAEVAGREVDTSSIVSMNFWCYPVEFMDVLKDGFPKFIESMKDPLKDEYLLPIIADGMVKAGVEYKVIPTDDQWFGVTYQEDKASVTENFRQMISDGVYSEGLYDRL